MSLWLPYGCGAWGDNGVPGEDLFDVIPPPPTLLTFTLLPTYFEMGGMHNIGSQGLSLSTVKPLEAPSS